MKKFILFVAATVLVLINVKSWCIEKIAPCNLVLNRSIIQDIQAKIEIANAIEAIGVKHTSMKQDLNSVLTNLQKCPDFGEIMLQKILDLLEAEIYIVDQLLCSHSGAVVEEAVNTRNDLLQHSIPSVAYVYDKVMDLATFDNDVNCKLYQTGCCPRRMAKVLNWKDKNTFLCSMKDKLKHYHAMMRQMQCGISVGSASVAVPISSDGDFINFCPVIK